MDPNQSVPGAVNPVPQAVQPVGIPQFTPEQPTGEPGVPQFPQTDSGDQQPAAGIGAGALQDGEQPQADPYAEWQRQQIMAQQQALYQQALQERQQREYLEQIALNQYIAQLPPEQAQIAQRVYAYNKQMQQQMEQLQYERQQAVAYAQQAEQTTLPLLKERALSELSQKYGVEKSLLRQTNSRQEAENLAIALSKYKKQAAFAVRQQTQVDNVPQTSGQASSGTDVSDIKAKYKNSGRIAKYVNELRRRGQWD